MEFTGLWDPVRVDRGETIFIQLGALKLWVERGEREWHIASERQTGDLSRLAVTRCRETPGLEWTRWVVDEEVDEVRLNPVMPDLPVIVRPEMPVCLLPNQTVKFYIGVPVWLAVSLGERYRNITEVATLVLSKSWFGPTTEGELCYAMRTTAKLREEDLLQQPHRAVIPFEIRNQSEEKMDFTRICLHTGSLRIYQGRERLWTNQGRATYRGEEKWSRVVYARGVPPFDGADRLVGNAREPVDRGAILRTFDNWKNLADF